MFSAPQFLTLCAQAQPGASPDGDLLDLMELLCRAGLDVRLRLLPTADLQQLLLLLLQNVREWPGKVRARPARPSLRPPVPLTPRWGGMLRGHEVMEMPGTVPPVLPPWWVL